MPGRSGLGGDRRVRRHADFVQAQRQGRRVGTAHFTLLVAAQREQAPPDRGEERAELERRPARLGVVVTRKVGGAVQRNRIKRLCRECFRTWPDLLPRGADLIVIARSGADRLSVKDVRREWEDVTRLLRKRAAEALARRGESHHPGRR